MSCGGVVFEVLSFGWVWLNGIIQGSGDKSPIETLASVLDEAILSLCKT